MASFNRVILMGNLCRDPDLKKTPSGLSVSEMRLAVSETFRNKATNERIERTCYVDVTVWNQQAELCRQYLSKGSPLFVEGRLVYDEWKTPAGETRSKLRVQADRIQFIGAPPPRPQGGPAPAQGSVPAAPSVPPPPPPASAPTSPDFSGDPSNDDPPF